MRLIDADVLMDDIRKHGESYFADDFAHIWVDKQPTVDAVPVRHGKWIYGESDSGYDGYYCSHCMGHVRWYGKAGVQSINFISDYHYCPNCGARMVEE